MTKGSKHTLETVKKMSLAKLGKPGNRKGKRALLPMPLERRLRISATMKGRPKSPEHVANVSKALLGKPNFKTRGVPRPPEVRRRISEGHLKSLKNCNGMLAQQRRKEPNSIEQRVYDELKNGGFLFERQYLINGKFVADAYIPTLNLVVEADGCYWHGCDVCNKPKRNNRDVAKDAYLKKCGFSVLRLKEHSIKDGTFIVNLKQHIEKLQHETTPV